MNKEMLMKSASSYNYQTKTAEVVITGVGTTSEISIIGQGRRFWITDIVPLLIESSTGRVITDKYLLPMDDIRVKINVCGKEMTERPIPLLSLLEKNNELFSGKMLEPNDRITFSFECNPLPQQTVGKGSYPILALITLKGYDLSHL